MWDDCSDDTGAFPKLKNTERNYIDVASGSQLVTSLNVFRTWMLSQFKTVLDGKKTMLESKSNLEDYWNSLCYVWKGKIYCLLWGTKWSEAWNLAGGFEKVVDIRVWALMFRRGKGTKKVKLLSLGWRWKK